MPFFVGMTCERQIQKLFHMFVYLKLHKNSRIVMDPNYPDIDKKSLCGMIERNFMEKWWRSYQPTYQKFW